MKAHQSHAQIINRLKRAKGHLEKVIGMIEDQKPCFSVAQQLHAVDSAISKARQVYVQDHIEHCLDDVLNKKSKASKKDMQEFKEITKYL